MSKFNESIKTFANFIDKNSSQILVGFGVVGICTTAAMLVQATIKSVRVTDELKEDNPDISKKELAKSVWKYYIPPVITGITSVSCMISSVSISNKRKAAFATAYKMSETAFRRYKDEVIETLGTNKEKEVRDRVSKKEIVDNPPEENIVIITEQGDTLFYDSYSGRYFKSDIEKLKKATNDLNRNMLDENFISLNEFYYEIGLQNVKVGEEMGWRIEDGYIELYFSAQIVPNKNVPCIVINFENQPKPYRL